MTLRMKRRASKLFMMSEGRKSQIVLLDERRLDIIIQPKLYSSELLDLVASHFKLKEKQYFGLGFFDDTSHFNWLQGEKRVLDHDFPKKTGLLVLHFAIKFYVDTIGLLRDIQTVELFYLNARQALYRGQLECDTETVFELAAHVLQATNGDFVSEEETREELKKLPVIPTCTLKEHPSIGYCEDKVICFYEKITGTSRGLAIVNYMTIVEKLATYGIHYYDVKDKKDIPWWLGISPKGIAVYDKKDKTTPRKLFTWKNLENLYYRDKKFSIEVHGPKRIMHTLSSFNPYDDAVREAADSIDDLSSAITDPTTQVSVSRRTFGASNVDVHAWFASTPQLTKCIWSMAVVQHQFYLDRKQSRSQLPSARSMSEIAADLCRSTTSLPGSLGSDLSRSPSSHSLPSLSNSRYDLTIEQSDSLKAERDMYQALKARKMALEESLKKKIEELKMLSLQEGELTGELPPDFPMAPGEQPPVFRRRVGTAFSLSVKNVQDTDQLSNELSKLELEVELQGKITTAAHRLASDKTVSKYVRKQRKQSYTKAFGKLKEMEKKLDDMRKKIRKPTSDPQAGRSADGMYSVQHPQSKCDLDFDDSINVHDLSANIQDRRCGSSGDVSDISGKKEVSSGYCSSATGSLSSISRQVVTDDTSSLSDSLNSTQSSRDNLSSDVILHTSGGTSKAVFIPAESQSMKPGQPERKRHFIIARGEKKSFREFRGYLNKSQPQVTGEHSHQVDLSIAASDREYSSDSTCNSSFTSVDVCDDTGEKVEQVAGTRVQRRKQTFIASKGVLKNFHLEMPKHNGFQERWKTVEQILMGDDHAHDTSIQPEKNAARTLRDALQNYSVPCRRPQELVERSRIRTAVRRSRSFDYPHDLEMRGREIHESVNRSGDDLKLAKVLQKLKDPTTHQRKPFIFHTIARNKPKPIKHFVS